MLVGFLSSLRASAPAEPLTLEAAIDVPISPSFWTGLIESTYVTRQQAISVPAVSRARNVVCGVIGSLPMNRWASNGDRLLDPIPLQYQPDPDSPRSVTMTWIADSLFFYGIAYVQVLELYADGRVSRMRWISPERVQILTNPAGTEITGYLLDGASTPSMGVGSLKAFSGPDQGLLYRAGRTIQTAIELEEAANRAAKEPAPQILIKDTGPQRTKEFITGMLDGWKEARRTRSTAYLNGDFNAEVIGFNPKDQQLVEARQFHASEIARAANVPAWFLNADVASLTYSNTEQERRSLIDFSLKPYMVAIEERMSMQDFLARDLYLRFDLDEFLRGSSKEEMEVITGYTAAGIMTIDEARERLDLIGDPSGTNL